MKYKEKKLEPLTDGFYDENGRELACWNDEDDEPTVIDVYGFMPIEGKKYQVNTLKNCYQYCAEIPKFDKSKFRVPRPKMLFKELLEENGMSEEEFMEIYDRELLCCGFVVGCGEDYSRCKGVVCGDCGLYKNKSPQQKQAWLNNYNIWKPKMRDMDTLEIMEYLHNKQILLDKGDGGVVVWDKERTDEYREWSFYSTLDSQVDTNLIYGILKNGKVEEFELPQVEVEDEL